MSFFEERKKMLEASTEAARLKYPKAQNFATGDGERYEESTLALAFLRCVRNKLEFLLSSNDEAGGKFDDMVLCWKNLEAIYALLVQLKHKTSAKQTTIRKRDLMSEKGNDFSLNVYHESYAKVRSDLDGGGYGLVLVTNLDLHKNAQGMFVSRELESVPGANLVDSGGCLYSLNPEDDDVKKAVKGDELFIRDFYLFCKQGNNATIKEKICAEIKAILAADERYCIAVCEILCSSIRSWMNAEEVCLTGSWEGWLKIVDTYVKEEVSMCNGVVTRIKFTSVDALRAHIEDHNPAWIRPPGSAATALSATKAHQAVCRERHIVVTAARFTEEKVLSCWGPFCPWLILVDDMEESCDILHRMAVLAGHKRRLVIVSYTGEDSFQDTCISGDIPDDAWKELIKVEIKLNGEQYLCCLENLCNTEGLKAMLDDKPEALVALSQLTGSVRMGQDLHPLPQNHIVRRLISRLHVREEFFFSLGDNDVCIMDKLSHNHLTNVSLNNTVMIEELEKYLCASNSLWPLFCITDNIDVRVIQMICSKYQNLCVYVLSYKDDGWEILFLHRGSAKIRPYVKEQPRSLWKIVDGLSSRIIVDGKPGIGKSTFLLDIASQVKGKNPSWWILRINLLTYSGVFSSYGDSDKALKDILLQVVYNKKNVGILEQSLLQHCLKNYPRIICLVDGFDEICPDYAEKCLQALQQLAPRRGKLVVATRPSVTDHLEAAMGVLAHSLPAFSEEEVHRFHQGCNSKLGVTDVVVELLKIPLFSRMYAEALESGIVVDDIVSLYETFFERKFRRLYGEKWGEDLSKPGMKRIFETERKKQENHLGFLAVSHLLPKLEVPCAAQAPPVDRDELVSAGVIYQFIDDKAVFIHRTFAEHFLAKWCFSDVAKGHCAKVYQAALSDNGLEFFVESFDRIASRGRPLLTAVLNGSEIEVESLLLEGADPAERDVMGRNSLHLAAAYSRDSALLWLLVDRLEVAGTERVGGSASGPEEAIRQSVKAEVVYEMDEVSRSTDKGTTSESLLVASDLESVEASGASGLWAVEKAVPAIEAVTAAFASEDALLQWTPLRYAVERRRWGVVPTLLEAGALLRHLGDFQRGRHQPQELWTVFKENGPNALFDHILGKINSQCSQMVQHRVEDPRSLEIQVGVSIVCAEMSTMQFIEIGAEILRHHMEVAKLLQFKIGEMYKKSTSTGSPELDLNWDTRHEAGLGSSIWQKLKSKLIRSVLKWHAAANGRTELHYAAAAGDAEGLRQLVVAGADVDTRDKEGYTAIHLAAASGNVSCVKLLLSVGAAVNMKDKAGETALHKVATLGRRNSVRLLLDAGADALAQNCQGVTPLHWAASRGNAECVRLLARAVKNLEVKDAHGCTALHYAAHSGAVDSVHHLLAAGADLSAVNGHLHTPLHVAAWTGHPECVRLLLRAGADVAAKTKAGASALHLTDNPDCVRCLLDAGAGVQEKDGDGDTPLHYAAEAGSAACVRLLLQEGADVHQRNSAGQTPLHWAAQGGHTECVRLLLDAGADALAQDAACRTPLQVAAASKSEACLAMLNCAVADRRRTTD